MSNINNIKSLCKQKGLKLNELASKTGMSYVQIQHLSTDKADLRKADFETILKIADALNCDAKDLFKKPYSKCVENWTYTKKNWGR